MHILNKCFEKVLVLTTNHKISEERRKRIIPRLDGIDYSFFYGVSHEDLDIQSYYDDGCQLAFPGQIGCAESFNLIYKHIIDNNIEKCLILEDDVIITDNINILEEAYNQLPDDWQLFYLGYGHGDQLPRPNYSKNLYKIDRYCGYQPHSCIGFAIGKEYAKILYEHNLKVTFTSDANIQHVLRKTDCVGYAVVPKIINHDGKDSVVENVIL